MASAMGSQPHSPPLTSNPKSLKPTIFKNPISRIKRRTLTLSSLTAITATSKTLFISPSPALSLDFRITTPDLTPEEAKSRAQKHAEELKKLESLISEASWKDAQKFLRLNASPLRVELNTIIQSRPGEQRPQLRNLYSKIFNSVTGVSMFSP
ncbi:hypothetical protein AMTR_s00029p00134700 [Amborella trichopoda]|uniref:Uncharacterized protein n=1 Tax=Amborella trichopoda TaxID=13333 RepID=W1PHP4_AMBTC|nr:hypothetical protein AMTR_s00029p00134700 [Amborella trichopoda]